MPTFRVVAGFTLLLSLLGGCGETPPPTMPPAAVTVVTLKAEPVTLSRELTGRVTSSLVAEIRPQVSGIVRDRLFKEGGLVEAGQVLYQLDDAQYKAQVARAKAAVVRGEAAAEAARLRAKRATELVKTHAISDQDFEGVISASRQADADVGVARAELELADIQLGYSRIVSPISGRIGRSLVTQGALVTANQDDALATVQQIDPIYVDLTQSSSEWLQLQKQIATGALNRTGSLDVALMLENDDIYPHSGELAFSEVSVEPTTGSYVVRVVVENPQGQLRPGMYVRAQITTGVRPEGVLVPQQGIARDPKGNTSAMVVDQNNTVQVRSVVVSQAVGNQWLVESGLAAGDRVIVQGLQKIQPGMKVEVSEEKSETAPSQPAAETNAQGNP